MGGGPNKSGMDRAQVFLVSGVASAVAETLTFPADVVKTRLQVQSGVGQRGIVQVFTGIIREEGVMSLYNGVFPACLRHFVYSGARMMIYETLREEVLGRDENGHFALWKGVVAGMSAGALGQLVASPTDLVKVQMQMDGKRVAVGKLPKYKSTFHCASVLFKEAGLRGMWRGWVPSCQRAALVQLGDLTSYDYFKQSALRAGFVDGPSTHALASAGAGLVAAFFGTPADVIKSRVMNQEVDSMGRGVQYRSTLDCFQQTVRNEGFFSLYKGFVPSWIRMAPWSLAYFITFEQLRLKAGLGSF